MTAPIRLDVFADYLCPWCYNAAVRLGDVQQAYGERVRLVWRTFPLMPEQRPPRRSTRQTQDSRQRVAAEEPRAQFVPPDLDSALPTCSIPALMLAKCAEKQGDGAFLTVHQRLFTAHFRDNLDISQSSVLWHIARESGLDMARCQQDYASHDTYQAVLHDYAEGMAWFGVSAVPTVIFDEKVSLVGAVPTERYRLLVEWLLAGAPGGVIPLDFGTPADGTAGRSVIGS
jgi:predicted DsbA family dithiol-disulfide isomerase